MPGFNINGNDENSVSSLKEPKFNHRWTIDQLVGISIERGSPLLFAQKLKLPEYTVDEEKIKGASLEYKFAKGVKWSDVTITFYDTLGLSPKIQEFSGNVFNQNSQALHTAERYKADSVFTLLDGSGLVIETYTLKNSWIKKVSHSELSYESSDIKTVTISLSYDWATRTGDTSTNPTVTT